MRIQANRFPSAPQDDTFLGQCKHPIALWTLPSDFIRFVSPCAIVYHTSSFLYIFVLVLYFCHQLEQQTGFSQPVSPTQGSGSGQHPARNLPSCGSESPAPQWDSLPKEIKFPLGPPPPSDFALAWVRAFALVYDCEQRLRGPCWVSPSRSSPAQQSPPRGLLPSPAGPAHPQRGYGWFRLWQIFLPTDFPPQRLPLGFCIILK